MTRRHAREFILQALFQYEFTGRRPARAEILDALAKKKPDEDALEFIDDIIDGTIGNMAAIDETISRTAKNWEFSRIAPVDRNILRFSVYELLFRPDIPAAVAINEAVDIAKKYSTSESYSFINGILDKIARTGGRGETFKAKR
jgi:N utilization substance protein B